MGARPEQDALMRMCTETVYADNPFHLLGLPTTATPRQIRRRREDLEGARELGQSAWEEAFHHLLGNRPTPNEEDVEEAFAKLEDPESRLLAEFFWMWPLGEEDPALKALQERHSGAAFEAWERAALGFGRSRPFAPRRRPPPRARPSVNRPRAAVLRRRPPRVRPLPRPIECVRRAHDSAGHPRGAPPSFGRLGWGAYPRSRVPARRRNGLS